MKMKRLFIWMILAVVGCVFGGCMTTEEEERIISSHRSGEEPEKWVGKHFSELVADWGPPDRMYDSVSVEGGKVLVWKHEFSCIDRHPSVTIVGDKGVGETYTGGDSITLTQHRVFKVDANGMIYRYEYSK